MIDPTLASLTSSISYFFSVRLRPSPFRCPNPNKQTNHNKRDPAKNYQMQGLQVTDSSIHPHNTPTYPTNSENNNYTSTFEIEIVASFALMLDV